MSRWQDVDATLGRLAARQHGLVTREQALGAGASLDAVEHRLETGRWERSAAGVYRLSGTAITWRQRALAACMDSGPGSLVSHRSAAVLWGVSGFRPGKVEITAPAGRSARSHLAIVHRSTDLPPRDITIRDGIPVSRPHRMIVDLAAAVGPILLREAVDDVLCRRLVSLDALILRAEEMGGRRGCRALRSVLEAWLPSDPVAKHGSGTEGQRTLPANVAEMRLARALIAHGLPKPVFQFEIFEGSQLIARVDLAYPQARVAIELDSFRWHAGRGPFRNDRVRGNRIEAGGWRLLRATTEDARSGDELCRIVRRLLASAA